MRGRPLARAVARSAGRAVSRAVLALAAPVLLAASSSAAPRLVVVGDVHGEIEGLTAILRTSGLVDAAGSWSGGEAVLVQTGDFTDRGPAVRQVMELLTRLEEEARAAGGRVEVLLGNHEAMNLVREYRDVGGEALAAFVDRRSERRRRQAWREWSAFRRRRARQLGLPEPRLDRDERARWMAAHPPGWLEYHEALSPGRPLGDWLRRRRVATVVGDTLLMHGGLGPPFVDVPLAEIEHRVAAEIEWFDGIWSELVEAEVILPFFDRREMASEVRSLLAAPGPVDGFGDWPRLSRRLEEIARGLDAMAGEWLTFRPDGPLWFRGYARWSEEELARFLVDLLPRLGVERVVSAHTPSRDGRVQSRADGRVLLVDTGMLSSYYRGGRASALEIEGDRLTAIYEGGEVVVRGPPLDRSPHGETAAEGPGPAAAAAAELPPRRLLGPDGEPLPFASDDEVLEFLASAEVVEDEELGEGITRPHRLRLELDGVAARAVFHDVDEVKETTRRGPRRRLVGFRDSWRNQVAAYRLSRLLGMDDVPPATVRRVGGVPGSAALWIEGAITERERLERGLEPAGSLLRQRRFSEMRVFDNLIYNIDRNQGNILLDSHGKIWLIDHTRSFGLVAELPEPEQVQRCSHGLWRRLRQLDRPALEAALGDLLDAGEIDALLARRDAVVELLGERAERMGERMVLFDWSDPDPAVVIEGEDARRPPL